VRRFTVVHLTGEEAVVAGVRFLETDEGWWMRTNEGTAAKTTSPPKDLRPGEKWIDVNLTTQTLVAFEGDKPVYATLVSTGKMNDDDKEKDHRTKPGSFRIREKHIAATMDGDVASDGPYSIEDVPWIMYFNASIALHGAFWHSNFGHVQSHGCVNLSPVDAKTLFGWTDPQLPAGWHGVMATDDRPGTRVIVHDPPESHPKWAP
jgi:lipoprotein-anchoring transpeptidase ErfK/SrfK